MKFSRLYFIAMGAIAILCGISHIRAQSTQWDTLLTNSHWYVQSENLLAYMSSGTSFANPYEAGDQTLWALGTATNGVFTGDSSAVLKIGPTSSSSTSTMQGVVTDSGQIRIIFTQSAGPTTTGIGQMRDIDGTLYMEMQMITGEDGSGGTLVTHWAYMTQYDPDNFTPPAPYIDPVLISQEWAWTEDTAWSFQNNDLFGVGGVGSFEITDYRNGYFWGSGTGPEGSEAESFTLLGSMTPEGNILYNLLSNDTLISLTGQITGDASTGQMLLRTYDGSGTFGDPGYASVIPEPSTWILLGVTVGFFTTWSFLRKRKSGANAA